MHSDADRGKTAAGALMARMLALLLLVPALGGCVLVVSPFDWWSDDNALTETVIRGSGDDKVLMLSITGFISDQPSEQLFGLLREESTLTRVIAELRKAAHDSAVKALVLRIDSPGGGVTASDAIYHRISTFAAEQQIPVVASLGGLAASGGYYVACAADVILAQPTTVTGSIGVILVGVNLSGLMDKLGIEGETFKSGAHKDLLSPLRGATPEERRIVEAIIHHLFRRFVSVVRENRPTLEREKLAMITDGRVFTAADALDLGLVDDIGRIQAAIDAAKRLAGLKQARVVVYRRPGESGETLFSSASGAAPRAAMEKRPNALPLDLTALTSPLFLYLWRPGL
ncbi:MAG: signal peptide peptidase SppA [Nitrococcus sp.]|nr:signal peptide peptidase SppA [Nitrococcus sp.]